MRAFVSFTLVTVLCVSGQPSAYSAEPDALLRHIEAEWEGKVVRDQAVPERPVIGIVFHCTSRVPDEVTGGKNQDHAHRDARAAHPERILLPPQLGLGQNQDG